MRRTHIDIHYIFSIYHIDLSIPTLIPGHATSDHVGFLPNVGKQGSETSRRDGLGSSKKHRATEKRRKKMSSVLITKRNI
jgi:hypothetical protein